MIDLIIEARRAAISAEMEVRRILPFRAKRMVGPFIFMDHAGPVTIDPVHAPAMDVLPHPHIGLSTVSYLFSGQVTHRDSLGVEQTIRPGEVNWMTAGKGIAHSERFEDLAMLAGNTLEMIQTWVALPEKAEESDPEFNNYKPEVLPVYTDKGVWMRMIAGSAFGLKNDVKIHSPLFYVHMVLQDGTSTTIPSGYPERAAYVARGSVEVLGRTYNRGQMIVFNSQAEPKITAKDGEAIVMLLGGDPLGERFIWWNFVSSRKERIEQAKADWKAGRIKLPPNDNREFVPLPEDRSKPAGDPPPQPLS
ncbi:MAG TPA: pirin family protein [Cyclobacteriaceae bacterium]|jgi:redox-sensitive bicupin YhaK (pirin superfamily)